MATNLDLTHEARGKIIAALKADADLNAIIPAARWYPQTAPATPIWPFGKMGAPVTTAQFIDGGDGSTYSAAVHCFTKASASTPDPETLAMTINSHVVRVLNSMEDIDIGDGLTLDVFPRVSQVMQDGDGDSFHGFVTFDAVAA